MDNLHNNNELFVSLAGIGFNYGETLLGSIRGEGPNRNNHEVENQGDNQSGSLEDIETSIRNLDTLANTPVQTQNGASKTLTSWIADIFLVVLVTLTISVYVCFRKGGVPTDLYNTVIVKSNIAYGAFDTGLSREDTLENLKKICLCYQEQFGPGWILLFLLLDFVPDMWLYILLSLTFTFITEGRPTVTRESFNSCILWVSLWCVPSACLCMTHDYVSPAATCRRIIEHGV